MGTAKVVATDGYDVTECFELYFEQESGERGVGLYTSGQGYQGSPSHEWVPSDATRQAVERAVRRLAALVVDPEDVTEATRNSLSSARYFFATRDRETQKLDPTSTYVVMGGPSLTIWRIQNETEVALVMHRLEPLGDYVFPGTLFTPYAVFDADGSGAVELYVHANSRTGWSDRVYSFNGGTWYMRAKSIGGSTA